MNQNETEGQEPFIQFLSAFNDTLKNVFYKKNNIEEFIQNRGFPALVLRDIMSKNPFSVAIPKEYGGDYLPHPLATCPCHHLAIVLVPLFENPAYLFHFYSSSMASKNFCANSAIRMKLRGSIL